MYGKVSGSAVLNTARPSEVRSVTGSPSLQPSGACQSVGGVMPSSKRMSQVAFMSSLPKSCAMSASAKEEKDGTTGLPSASTSTSTLGSGVWVR